MRDREDEGTPKLRREFRPLDRLVRTIGADRGMRRYPGSRSTGVGEQRVRRGTTVHSSSLLPFDRELS